jgi:uncharacterized protein with HEPN domain
MPHKDTHLRLQHMLEAAEELLQFTAGKTYADLLADRGLQHICIRCLEIIGEAAYNIDPAYQDAHPSIPWRPIIAMRHRLIHGYCDVELTFVWSTISEDLPILIPILITLIAAE